MEENGLISIIMCEIIEVIAQLIQMKLLFLGPSIPFDLLLLHFPAEQQIPSPFCGTKRRWKDKAGKIRIIH